MRFAEYLKEEWEATIHKFGVSIYKNPSSSDYRKLRKELGYSDLFLRVILDVKNKDIYVFDALTAIHIDGWNVLNLKTTDDPYDILFGAGDLKPGDNKLSGMNEFLSAREYISHYAIGKNFSDYIYNEKGTLKRLEWVKKYFKRASITSHKDIRGARIIIG
jgi:hypothetical protein